METRDWKAMKDLIESFQNQLAAFETAHRTALHEEHWTTARSINGRPEKPLGDVFEGLEGALKDALGDMPKITSCDDYWTDDDEKDHRFRERERESHMRDRI